MMKATWGQVHSLRVRQHFLSGPPAKDAVEVARRLLGVHAQVASSAEIAIGIRAADTRPGDVRRAVEVERTLVKTWTLRGGTLHLVPPEDLPMWFAVLPGRARLLRPSHLRHFGITADDVASIFDALPRALDGNCLTREELARAVAEGAKLPHLEESLRSGWGGLLKPAASEGLMCFGPDRGRNVTFVSTRDWIGPWKPWKQDDAIAEILRRFLGTYGPATREHFGMWFGGSSRALSRAAFQRLADELVEVDVEGRRAWTTQTGAKALAMQEVAETVRLLPAFDPYTVGYLGDLQPLLPGPHRDLVSRVAGWISPTVLVRGRLLGTWRHEMAGGRMRIAVTPFAKLTRRVRSAVEADAEKLAALLGARAEVSWEAQVPADAPGWRSTGPAGRARRL